MGPAAWASVGRTLAVALASSLFKGESSLVVLLAKRLERAIAEHNLELASSLLQDLAYRHRRAFDEFIERFGADLPPDVRDEFQKL